jgi:hypothetical protein
LPAEASEDLGILGSLRRARRKDVERQARELGDEQVRIVVAGCDDHALRVPDFSVRKYLGIGVAADEDVPDFSP